MAVLPYGRLFAGLLLVAGASALAGGCGATINVVDCDDGEVRCGDTCVDLDSDSKHCGECFSRCVDGCTDGVCDGGGPGGGSGTGGSGQGASGQGGEAGCGVLTDCNGECVDLSTDENHCGACEYLCDVGAICQAGDCHADVCAPLTECNGVCIDVDSDPFNCGQCGRVCPSGLCAIGDCVDTCPPNLVDCGTGTCVDLSSDEQNCGGCFFPCGFEQQCVNFSCVGGSCDLACGLCQIVELPSTTSVSISGSTSGAGNGVTSLCAGETGAPEIAHHYFAPVSGTYVIDTFGSEFDTVLSVLSGCGEVTCSDDVKSAQSQVVVDLFAGEEVFFVVDGFGTGSEGFYVLNLRLEDGPQCPPGLFQCGDLCVDIFSDPQNCGGCFIPCGDEEQCFDGSCECVGPGCNECDSPTCGSCSSVFSLPSTVPLTRSGSTQGEDDGIFPGCVDANGPEELYTFQAPFAASYRFDTFGSSYDTILSVRSAGGCGELACNDDFEGLDSFVELPLAAGQQVVVVVDGFGDSGAYQLHVDADIPLCAPILDGSLPIEVIDTTAGQPDTFSTSCVGEGAPERMYHFFAPTSKLYTFDMTGSSYDTVLEILDGTCGGPSLGCNDDFIDVASHLEVFLEQDQLITIIVDGWGGGSGPFTLSIE